MRVILSLVKYIARTLLYSLRLVKLKTKSRKKILFISNFFVKNFTEFYSGKFKSIILMDPFTVPEWVITNSYFVNILAKEKKSIIKTYGSYSRIESPIAGAIFKSFNIIDHVRTTLQNKKLIKEKDEIVLNLRRKIKTKKELFNLKINSISAGIDIYETYLKKGHATVDFDNEVLWNTLDEAVELILFWSDFFNNNNVSSVVLSHDCYIHMNILAKISYMQDVPVYLVNSKGMHKVNAPFSLYESRFKNYREYFNVLPTKKKSEAIQWAKGRINARLSGQITDMSYSTISAFQKPIDNSRILSDSGRVKVLIAVHDFYDNPHGYGGMLFTDFYVWLEFLADISNKTNYDWYIKTHPDTSKKTLEVLKGVLLKNSTIKIIPKEASFIQLAEEGLDFVLTCFGSVGHELPLLGVQVINACRNNPHIAYNFNWHAESVDHYRELLMKLPLLNINIDPNEIYEFYYMHYKYCNVDDLIYISHSKMLIDLDESSRLSLDAYVYFIKKLSEEKNEEIKRKMINFITSEKKDYFINGPEG